MKNLTFRIHLRLEKLRVLLWLLLVLQLLILLLMNPTFPGIPLLEGGLRKFSALLKNVFLPSTADDMNTYKGLILRLCTFVSALPFYPAAAKGVVWVVPGLLLTSYVLYPLRVLVRRSVRRRDRSGLFTSAAIRANAYHDKMAARCVDPFPSEAGIRVQMLSGPAIRQDNLYTWNENREIVIHDAVQGKLRLTLENGLPVISGSPHGISLECGAPYVTARDSRSGQPVYGCAITRLSSN